MHLQEHNHSPWLDQIKRSRPLNALTRDIATDVAIVGAGIAGAVTAYFTLLNTHKRVVVLEAGRVAHGATGHNAGQVVSYFERPFSEIVREFGKEKAIAGLADVESGWKLIEDIYQKTGIDAPLTHFTGYAGCATVSQIIRHLKNDAYRLEGGLPRGPVIVDERIVSKKIIPPEYDGMYVSAPQADILNLLESDDARYIAALGSRKGCLNSARFTEELFSYLLRAYPNRFDIFEYTPVSAIHLGKESARLLSLPHAVLAKRVVLCTNGFEYLKIENEHGEDINKRFHHMIKGSIGYMAAYHDDSRRSFAAISYFPIEESDASVEAVDAAPYYYLTRRLHKNNTNAESALICIGGPEKIIEDTTMYSKQHAFSKEAYDGINTFLRESYRHAPKGKISYAFLWHGLMGYTPNGIRRVGSEPHNPVLLYNLGCNGIGILPAFFAGERISRIVRGDKLESSIFDVKLEHTAL